MDSFECGNTVNFNWKVQGISLVRSDFEKMGAAYDQDCIVPLESSRKRKTRSRGNGSKSVAETLAKWKEYNENLSSVKEGKLTRKAPAKG